MYSSFHVNDINTSFVLQVLDDLKPPLDHPLTDIPHPCAVFLFTI